MPPRRKSKFLQYMIYAIDAYEARELFQAANFFVEAMDQDDAQESITLLGKFSDKLHIRGKPTNVNDLEPPVNKAEFYAHFVSEIKRRAHQEQEMQDEAIARYLTLLENMDDEFGDDASNG